MSHPEDESSFMRVERHFDDRDRMYPAADLLRLVARHKHDAGFKHLLPWMMRVETALEFMVDLDDDIAAAETSAEQQAALAGAKRNAEGIRQLLDAFDGFLAEDPEVFEATLEAADAAFEKRIAEYNHLRRQAPVARTAAATPEGSATGWQGLWDRLRAEIDRQVERRAASPEADYGPLRFLRKSAEDRRHGPKPPGRS